VLILSRASNPVTLGTLRPVSPGAVAEWLRSGLQSRLLRFESGRRLYWDFEARSRGPDVCSPSAEHARGDADDGDDTEHPAVGLGALEKTAARRMAATDAHGAHQSAVANSLKYG
jgi:hypothetical protein